MATALRTSTTAPTVRAVHAALGILGFVTMGVSLRNTIVGPDPHVVNFFSYFTIESNLFAAAIWIWVAVKPDPTEWQDRLRGAATLFMVITGIVYAILLSGIAASAPWINTVEHRILPAAILINWIVVPPAQPIRRGTALSWLLVPLVFFVYSLIRGAVIDWYPYPFMSPIVHGYPTVFVTALVLTILIAALALGLAAFGSWRSAQRAST